MANPKLVARLVKGADEWNRWRWNQPRLGSSALPGDLLDLSGAVLAGLSLMDADLSHCNLDGARFTLTSLTGASFVHSSLRGAHFGSFVLSGARFSFADLTGATFGRSVNLRGVSFRGARMQNVSMPECNGNAATFEGANLAGATLRGGSFQGASFSGAALSRVDLTGADLSRAQFVDTVLDGACMDDSVVYGASVWNTTLNGTTQRGLVVTPKNHAPVIAVDDLLVAQFIHVCEHEAVRRVINSITSNVVLMLGSFCAERKPILNALRDALRHANYTPVVFDFEKPATRDVTETVSTLAHMARFVIADLTDAKSVRQELERVVPDLPSVPVQPLILAGQEEFAMFDHFRNCQSVLEPVRYESQDTLIASLGTTLIPNVAAAVKRLRP